MPATHAETMLSLIEAALEGRIPTGMESYTIEGQTVAKMPLLQLHSLRQKYRNERAIELAAASAAAGVPPRRRIGFRFVSP